MIQRYLFLWKYCSKPSPDCASISDVYYNPIDKECDISVQPSYEDGNSVTICEAGVLGKAIIDTTTSGGIREQIHPEISGLLAEPDPKSIAENLWNLLMTQKKKERLKTTLAKSISHIKMKSINSSYSWNSRRILCYLY